MHSTAIVLLAIFSIVLLAGTAAPAAGEGQGPVAHTSAVANVNIREFAFHPGKLTVARGTKVVFANRDSTAHTVTRKGSFETGRIRPGHSKALTFKHSGTFAYHCSIHNFMHGKVVVR